MTRPLDPASEAAYQAEVVREICLVRLDLAAGALRLCSAPFPVSWDDGSGDGLVEWRGVGELGQIDAVEEGGEQRAYSLQFALTGVDPTFVSIALQTPYRNREAWLWSATCDDGFALIGTPALLFRGRMDVMPIEAGQTATVSVVAHSRLVDWERPRIKRYTNADQLVAYPGDRGLEFVAEMKDKELVWGQTVGVG